MLPGQLLHYTATRHIPHPGDRCEATPQDGPHKGKTYLAEILTVGPPKPGGPTVTLVIREQLPQEETVP